MFWQNALQVSDKALKSGTLAPIITETIRFESEGIECLGSVVSDNMRKKPIVRQVDNHSPSQPLLSNNPFLPYEEEMFVAKAGEQHVCLLNKYPIISPHLLICTRQFKEQTQPLQRADFSAWLMAFGQDSDQVLGFFNGGMMAGASQPHRHMQLVKTEIPLETVIAAGELPFTHQLHKVDKLDASQLHRAYLTMMEALALLPKQDGAACQPYNLLLTARWMLLLPRSTNQVNGLYANGINYSGRFLVKEPEQLNWLKNYGILKFLAECT